MSTATDCPYHTPVSETHGYCQLAGLLAGQPETACKVQVRACEHCLTRGNATLVEPTWVVVATAGNAAYKAKDKAKYEEIQAKFGHLLSQRPGAQEPKAPAVKLDRPKLTIGMATVRDFNGVYFTLMAIRMYHPEVIPFVEFVVVDNAPGSPESQHVKDLVDEWVKANGCWDSRYIPMESPIGTAAPRDRIFQEAKGDVVLVIDCHVLIKAGALKQLIQLAEKYPDNNDLWHGPLLADNGQIYATHMDPVWRGRMLGIWAADERGANPAAAPFEIPMHGLGLFACRRTAWPGFNPGFRGFGGEEGYIHRKFERLGRKTLCLPFLRWHHRFGYIGPPTYPNLTEDRVRNYLLGSQENEASIDDIREHFIADNGITEETWQKLVAEVYGVTPLPSRPIKQVKNGELPAAWRLAYNFSKALVKHVMTGSRKLSPEEAGARLDICKGCDLIRDAGNGKLTCSHPQCGCKLMDKTTWASEACPIGKWTAVSETVTA